MFLQPSDFAVEGDKYLIPNILTGDVDWTGYIDEVEEAILRQILGDVLYDEFILGLATLPTIPQQWLDLRDGASYVYHDKPQIYKGIKYVLKPYVFSEWMTDHYDNVTSSGVDIPTVENGETVSPATKIVLAYNTFVSRLGCEGKQRGTMYGFLNADPVSYSAWEFDENDEIEDINIWNI